MRRSDLTKMLSVMLSALDIVALAARRCRHMGCALFASEHNVGYCVLVHSQSWFLRELDRLGQPLSNRRGYGLHGHGPQFLRNYTGKMVSLCCCSSALCKNLGYIHEGVFHFPKNGTGRRGRVGTYSVYHRSTGRKLWTTLGPYHCAFLALKLPTPL